MKIRYILGVFIVVLSFLLLPSCKNEEKILFNTPASAGALTQDELIILIEKTKSPEERKDIYEKNRDKFDRDFVIKLLVKASNSFDEKTFSLEKSRNMIKIAMEISEFIHDKQSLAKSYLYNSSLEMMENKSEPPGLKKALDLFQSIGDQKGEALCYIKEAHRCHYDLKNDDKALMFIDKALKIFNDGGEDLLAGDAWALKGIIYKNERDKNKSIESFNKAIELYEKHNDLIRIISSYSQMSFICRTRGFMEESEKYLQLIRKLIENMDIKKINNFPEDGYAFRNMKVNDKNELILEYYYSPLAGLYSVSGKYEQTIKTYQKIIEIGQKLDKRTLSEMFSYIFLADIYISLGQKDMAQKYYLKALSKNENVPVYQIWGNYIATGSFYLNDMKQPDEAMKYYLLALKKADEMGFPEYREQYRAITIRYIGQVYKEKGDFDTAIKKIKESVELFKKIENKFGSCDFYFVALYALLGELYKLKGDKKQALSYFEKSVEVAEKTNISGLVSKSYQTIGRFYFEENKLDKSLDFYLKAIKTASDPRSPKSLWEYYFFAGQIYEKQGNFKEAYNAYDNSIEIIETMRQEFKVEELKRDFMQDKIKVYEGMINLLMKMKRYEDAFDYNEKARARAFLDILSNQKIDIHHGVKPELISKEEELRTRIQYLSSDMRQEREKKIIEQRSAFIRDTDEELKSLKLEYERLLEQIKLENPEYMTLVSAKPLSLKEIRPLLDKDTVIIEYFLGDKMSCSWIISNDKLNTVILNHNRKELEKLVRSYRENACDRITLDKLNSNKWRDISYELYNILFKHMEKYLKGKKRIVIVPHRVLHYMPFEAFDNNGKFLIENYEISYLPSASVLKYCRDKNVQKKDRLLAFEIGNLKVGNLSAIPSTEEEVKRISVYFSDKKIYAGNEMKTEGLYNDGSKYNVLHFATHGIMDSASPLFSSLVFADRKLNTYEIFDLNLKAYLVCLSACSTGMGEEASGDELVGLSRGFIYAGTPTVCSSLWDVSDVSTAELMDRFYFYLKDKNKSEALRLAKLDVMKKYPHPFFWAPFVLIGDWN